MNPEKIITGLTAAQADRLACVVCGRDYLRASVAVSFLVGRSLTGSQVFACEVAAAKRPGTTRRWPVAAWVVIADEHHAERRTIGA